jgi:type 1 glutamine amidotransferase
MSTTVLKTTSVAISLIAAAAAWAGPAEPTVAQPTNDNVAPGAADNFDPVYNVCRGTDPRCYHPWVETRQNKVLIYTRTAGPRHANLGPALGPGKNPPLSSAHVVQNALIAWMVQEGVVADWTEDVTQLSNLNQYKAVIFASTSRDTLHKHGTAVSPTAAVNTTTNAHLDAGRTALRQYIRAGGGFVGIHNAFGTEYNWPWYEGLLGNANYYDHGANQNGTVNVVAADASTAGVGSFGFKDEWYNLVPFPTRVKFLATVDENTLATRRTTHPGHGSFHPVAWCQYYDGGRAWLTTLGHDGQAFIDGSGFPGQPEFKKLVVGGILSAMGNRPFCQ